MRQIDLDLKASEAGIKTSKLLSLDGHMVIHLAMKQGELLPAHHTAQKLLVIPVYGEIKMRAGGSTHQVKPGSILQLEPMEIHDVEAIVDSHVLLVKL